MDTVELFERLGVALALGLLIGLERGWQRRHEAEGARIAGLRTFGLLGLLGGVWAMLSRELGPVVLAFGLVALTAALILAHLQRLRTRSVADYGITTLVAALLTFALGALAVLGYTGAAAAAAVVSALLLGMKPLLHEGLTRLSSEELFAVFKLALISLVILPVLPDRGFGPWGVFNPWATWWLVVLIAGISSVGYFSMRVLGPGRGIPLTGLLGGLTSSTATTLSLGRMSRHNPRLHRILAVGVIVAASTMFPRMLLEIAVVHPPLLVAVAPGLATMAVLGAVTALLLWWRSRAVQAGEEVALSNPFEIGTALQFGALLVIVMVLAEAARQWFGDAGLLALAGLSGLTDVDAITLSVARMARDGLGADVASAAIMLAATVNTAVKVALVAVIGDRAMAAWLALALAVVIAGGGLAWWLV